MSQNWPPAKMQDGKVQWIIPKKKVLICTIVALCLYNIQHENLVFKKSLSTPEIPLGKVRYMQGRKGVCWYIKVEKINEQKKIWILSYLWYDPYRLTQHVAGAGLTRSLFLVPRTQIVQYIVYLLCPVWIVWCMLDRYHLLIAHHPIHIYWSWVYLLLSLEG